MSPESQPSKKHNIRKAIIDFFNLDTGHWEVPSLSSAPLPLEFSDEHNARMTKYINSGRMHEDMRRGAEVLRRRREAEAEAARAADPCITASLGRCATARFARFFRK